MHEAIGRMLQRYECRDLDGHLAALREIIQEVALLGLWRAKFFEHAAFYGGTALRVLHGLDRFSEDLGFTLMAPSANFDLGRYLPSLQEEVRAFGFEVRAEAVVKKARSAVQSAFLKADTRRQLMLVQVDESVAGLVPGGQLIKVKLEVDTDPPAGFETEARYLLNPVPFSVRVCKPPDLLAGKLHAAMFRQWKNCVKGRDWYDLVWFAANHPKVRLAHLEERMRQTGHWTGDAPLNMKRLRAMLADTITRLDVEQARSEVAPFVKDPRVLDPWSVEFFMQVASRLQAC